MAAIKKTVACVMMASACAGILASPAQAVQFVPNTDPGGFYSAIPNPGKAAPGTVLSTQVKSLGLADQLVSVTYFSYASTHPAGTMVPVSGMALVPKTAWTGPGTRPVALLAPGTIGASDACAPSKLANFGLEYEQVAIAGLLQRGFIVAMTDYQGLGTSGAHTYMNREAQGAAVLDMGRAVPHLGLPGVDADTRYVLWGFSQGGGASAAAAEMQARYAPDVNVVAGYAGGVPADLLATAQSLEGTPMIGFLGYSLNSMQETDPETYQAAMALLNDRGKAWVAQEGQSCSFETFSNLPVQDSSIYSVSGNRVTQDLAAPQFQDYFSRQRLGLVAPSMPMFVAQATNDDVIPVGPARQMVENWRAGGTQVDYWEDPVPLFARMGPHAYTLQSAFPQAMNWMMRQLAVTEGS